MSTILACTDGSLYARSIYQHAAWAASRLTLPVHILHVIERDEAATTHDFSGSLGFHASEELMEELTKLDESHARVARLRGTAILEDAAKQIEEHMTLRTQRHGSLVDTVVEFEQEAALVILGKRGEHADFSRGHLGSNLERVVRAVKVPVLVASQEFHSVKRFLIAFDGGSSALRAIEYAASNSLLTGAECHLVAVGMPGSDLARALESAATVLRGAGYEVDSELLSGDPDEIISSKVRDAGIDLLVMGAYGHSRIREFILGSTTTNLIRTCRVPVLLFR